MREIDAFVPIVDTIMFLSDLIIATLLYAQASVFRSGALTVLASVYVFSALLIVAHALSFPGAFTPGGLLGAGLNTTAWIFVIRRVAFPSGSCCMSCSNELTGRGRVLQSGPRR